MKTLRNSLKCDLLVLGLCLGMAGQASGERPLVLDWNDNLLTIRGDIVAGGPMEIWYLEAYCRDGAHEAHWRDHTVVGHKTELVDEAEDGSWLKLACSVNDGLTVEHLITAKANEVSFQITARNPTGKVSEARWGQPCVRVGGFTGTGPDVTDDKYAYLEKSFVFLDGKLEMMPTPRWATDALYEPGQVWAAPGVDPRDVNPRPLHPDVPSNGLIGCFSEDGKTLFAVAFEPYHELFQGVIRCLHSDFRLGAMEPNETREIRGKIYFENAGVDALLERYYRDFPEHRARHKS